MWYCLSQSRTQILAALKVLLFTVLWSCCSVGRSGGWILESFLRASSPYRHVIFSPIYRRTGGFRGQEEVMSLVLKPKQQNTSLSRIKV